LPFIWGFQESLATEDNEENKDFVLTAEKRAKPSDTNSTNSHESTQPRKLSGKPYVVGDNSPAAPKVAAATEGGCHSCPWHPWPPQPCAEAAQKICDPMIGFSPVCCFIQVEDKSQTLKKK